MKISSEAKVGIIGIVTALVLIWGINYLKGRNILNRSYAVVTLFDASGGLESSAPVLLKGVKIGFVDRIELSPADEKPVKVTLSIDRKYPLNRGSRAKLISADLLGTKAIGIESFSTGLPLKNMDTIPSSVEEGLLPAIEKQIMPVLEQVGDLAASLDSLSGRLTSLAEDPGIQESLDHIASVSGSLDRTMGPGGSLSGSLENLEAFTGMMAGKGDAIGSVIDNLQRISRQLQTAGLDSLTRSLNGATNQLSLLLQEVNSGTGSVGKLIYSDSLYRDIRVLVADLDSLARDLKENPGNYVRVSVFGRSGDGGS